MSQFDPVTSRGNHREPATGADDVPGEGSDVGGEPDELDEFDDEVLDAFAAGDSDQDDDFADLVDRLRRAGPPTAAPDDPAAAGRRADRSPAADLTDPPDRSAGGAGGAGGETSRTGETGRAGPVDPGAARGRSAALGPRTTGAPRRSDVERRGGGARTATAELMAGVARRAEDEGLLDVAWTLTDSPVGPLTLAATPVGLVRIEFGHSDTMLEELADRVSPRVLEAPARLDGVRRQLDEYFAGRRQRFEIDLDWTLSQGFRRTVLHKLVEVPYGHTLSYKELAELAGNPKASRATGTAMATNPIPLVVPCHRVLRSGGKLGGYGGGLDAKVWLLRLEGHPLLA